MELFEIIVNKCGHLGKAECVKLTQQAQQLLQQGYSINDLEIKLENRQTWIQPVATAVKKTEPKQAPLEASRDAIQAKADQLAENAAENLPKKRGRPPKGNKGEVLEVEGPLPGESCSDTLEEFSQSDPEDAEASGW